MHIFRSDGMYVSLCMHAIVTWFNRLHYTIITALCRSFASVQIATAWKLATLSATLHVESWQFETSNNWSSAIYCCWTVLLLICVLLLRTVWRVHIYSWQPLCIAVCKMKDFTLLFVLAAVFLSCTTPQVSCAIQSESQYYTVSSDRKWRVYIECACFHLVATRNSICILSCMYIIMPSAKCILYISLSLIIWREHAVQPI